MRTRNDDRLARAAAAIFVAAIVQFAVIGGLTSCQPRPVLDGPTPAAPSPREPGPHTNHATLRDQVARYAGGLAGIGIGPGDRVAILAGTNWYFVATYLADTSTPARRGRARSTRRRPPAEVAGQLADTGAKALFVEARRPADGHRPRPGHGRALADASSSPRCRRGRGDVSPRATC